MGKEKSCACSECKAMCQRPCWPTPDEAQKLIDAGYSNRLMLDYWARGGGDIDILSPALNGYEGQRAPFWPTGQCTFQNDDGLCELHNLGLKPLEGRVSLCKNRTPKTIHKRIAKMWDNPQAQELAENWHHDA